LSAATLFDMIANVRYFCDSDRQRQFGIEDTETS